jgi:hypothetical protein
LPSGSAQDPFSLQLEVGQSSSHFQPISARESERTSPVFGTCSVQIRSNPRVKSISVGKYAFSARLKTDC